MTLQSRLAALASALGTDVKSLETAIEQLNSGKADRGELSELAQTLGALVELVNTKSAIYKATAGDPVGAGQPAGTWIARPV